AVYFVPGAGELTIFCGALMGAALGVLWFNAHPAQVFMGDTGALAIGGALGTVAILLKAEFLLLIAGGVFAAEAVSVLLQTGAYRWPRRRRGRVTVGGAGAPPPRRAGRPPAGSARDAVPGHGAPRLGWQRGGAGAGRRAVQVCVRRAARSWQRPRSAAARGSPVGAQAFP